MVVGREDVLEEAAEELEGRQFDVPPGPRAAVAKGPAQASIGQELELAIDLRVRLLPQRRLFYEHEISSIQTSGTGCEKSYGAAAIWC